ncbi:MAG: winged helix DNA-binding domain-containing protein [Candidatus Dormibacteria bacterium]
MADRAIAALLQARFAAQRLSDGARLGADPAAVARAVCAVQAQELNAGCLSLRARAAGLTRDIVVAALDHEPTLAWAWLMRGTLHICAADDLRWLLSLFGPLNARRYATRRAELGLDADVCARGIRVVRRALAHGPLPRSLLRERLLAGGIDVLRDSHALIHFIAFAASQGVIVVLPPTGGRENRFGLLEDMIPAAPALGRERAEATLARRYFGAFGPATVADFRVWAGIPAGMAQRAAASIDAELEAVDGPVPGLMRIRAQRERSDGAGAGPTARLLPRWDTYVLGYRSRDVMLHPSHAPVVSVGGVIKPTVCVDGAIDGAWELRRERSGWQLELSPFRRFSGTVMAQVVAEADDIAAYLNAPVRIAES